jgi:hypothetical protein
LEQFRIQQEALSPAYSGDRNLTRRPLTLVPIILFAFVLSLAAQQQPAPATDAPQATGSTKQNKKAAADEATVFDERAAAQVLGTIRDGLEGHSGRRLLSAFDAGKMDDFLTFQDQIEAYFNRYESFRVTLRILQTSEENNRGVILAEFQVENEPRGGGRISTRRGQLRFELEPSAKGWKIVNLDPRGFFS